MATTAFNRFISFRESLRGKTITPADKTKLQSLMKSARVKIPLPSILNFAKQILQTPAGKAIIKTAKNIVRNAPVLDFVANPLGKAKKLKRGVDLVGSGIKRIAKKVPPGKSGGTNSVAKFFRTETQTKKLNPSKVSNKKFDNTRGAFKNSVDKSVPRKFTSRNKNLKKVGIGAAGATLIGAFLLNRSKEKEQKVANSVVKQNAIRRQKAKQVAKQPRPTGDPAADRKEADIKLRNAVRAENLKDKTSEVNKFNPVDEAVRIIKTPGNPPPPNNIPITGPEDHEKPFLIDNINVGAKKSGRFSDQRELRGQPGPNPDSRVQSNQLGGARARLRARLVARAKNPNPVRGGNLLRGGRGSTGVDLNAIKEAIKRRQSNGR